MKSTRLLAAFSIVLALSLSTTASLAQDTTKAPKKADLTGTWLFTVTTDAGTGTPTMTLKQSGDTLSGHYSSQTLGEHDLKGSVKDRKVTLTFSTDIQGTTLVVIYTGTIDSNDAMKGSIDLGGMATGTFTATRKK